MASEVGGRPAARRRGLVSVPADGLRVALRNGELALHDDGDLQASRDSFERAYQLAEKASDVQAMAAAALGLAGLWVSERRTMTGAVMLAARLRRVLALLDEHSSLALRIRARLAGEADYLRGEHTAILGVLDEARATADADALAEALSIAHHCLLGPDYIGLRRGLAVELITESFRTGRRSDLLMGLLLQTVDSYADGDPHAGRFLGELRDQLSRRDHAAVGFVASAIDVMLAIRAGHLDDAESLASICAKQGATAGDIDSEWWPGAQLVTIRWYQGRLTELLPMLHDRVHSPALSAVDNSAVAALAVAAALAGERRTAAGSLAELRADGLARLPRSSSWLVTMNGVVEAACLLDDAETAAEAYDLLRPYARLPMVGGLGVTCFGSTQQALGVAALTIARLDVAIDHLRTAVQHNLALRHWPALVSARQRLACAYRLRGFEDDDAAAERELQIARSEAAATGLDVVAAGRFGPSHVGSALATCERAGRRWRVTVASRSVLVEDSIGMLHLAVLIANPRLEVAAADLVSGLAVLGGAASGTAAAQPILDRTAIVTYRNRLTELDAEIDRLTADGEGEPEAAQAQAERQWLMEQLASAASTQRTRQGVCSMTASAPASRSARRSAAR